MKAEAYQKHAQTFENLEKIISDEWTNFPLAIFQKISINFILRLRYAIEVNGRDFENILIWFSFIKKFWMKGYVILNFFIIDLQISYLQRFTSMIFWTKTRNSKRKKMYLVTWICLKNCFSRLNRFSTINIWKLYFSVPCMRISFD